MEIRDKCQCGSVFTVELRRSKQVIATWITWVNAHAPCRNDDRKPITFQGGSATVSAREKDT